MTTKFRQGDLLTIQAVVKTEAGHDLTVILKAASGQEQRVRVPKTVIVTHERGPLKAGDTVFKKVKAGRIEGTVQHRVGDLCWVTWGEDAHSVEPVAALSR